MAIFIHASIEEKKRKEHWEELVSKSRKWGQVWFIGGDSDDIIKHKEKMEVGKDLTTVLRHLETSLGSWGWGK